MNALATDKKNMEQCISQMEKTINMMYSIEKRAVENYLSHLFYKPNCPLDRMTHGLKWLDKKHLKQNLADDGNQVKQKNKHLAFPKLAKHTMRSGFSIFFPLFEALILTERQHLCVTTGECVSLQSALLPLFRFSSSVPIPFPSMGLWRYAALRIHHALVRIQRGCFPDQAAVDDLRDTQRGYCVCVCVCACSDHGGRIGGRACTPWLIGVNCSPRCWLFPAAPCLMLLSMTSSAARFTHGHTQAHTHTSLFLSLSTLADINSSSKVHKPAAQL